MWLNLIGQIQFLSKKDQLSHSTKLNICLGYFTRSFFSNWLFFFFSKSTNLTLVPQSFVMPSSFPLSFLSIACSGPPFKACFPLWKSLSPAASNKAFQGMAKKKVQTFGISILISKGRLGFLEVKLRYSVSERQLHESLNYIYLFLYCILSLLSLPFLSPLWPCICY